MPVRVAFKYKPDPRLRRVLASMRAPELNKALSRALLKCAQITSDEIALNQIIRGGRYRVGSKMFSKPPHPTRLTSRSGDLRRSLGRKHGIDASGIPRYIDVGTDLIYGAAHEFGSPKRHLPPRPFIRPGMEAMAEKYPDIFLREWRREVGV